MNERITCPFCGFSRNVETSGIPDQSRGAICPKCKRFFPLRPGQPQGEANESPVDGGKEAPPSMVQHGQSGEEDAPRRLFPGLPLNLLRAPYDFFRRREALDEKPGTWFSFGLLFGSVGTMLIVFWRLASMSLGPGPGAAWPPILLGAAFMLSVVLTPVWVVLAMLVNTLVAHFCLWIVGAGREGWKATFRVVAYSQAAKSLGIFPIVGGPAAFLWQLVIQVIGLREVHGISSIRLLMGLVAAVGFLILTIMGCVVALPK